MKPTLPSINSSQLKADLYLQLSRMEEAGLTPQHAVEVLDSHHNKTTKHLKLFQQYLKAGKSITESGFNAGIFSTFDKEIIHAGETSGNMENVYKQLAKLYANKAINIKQIKTKLSLPVLILTLFIFIQPLPALIVNTISASEYLWASIGTLLRIALLFYIILNLVSWLTRGPLKFLGLAKSIYQLQLLLPWISKWFLTRQINNFLTYLSLMLSAGIAISEALPKAINTINNPLFGSKFNPAASAINKGSSLTESLRLVPEMDEKIIQQIKIGEESGKLAETIQHFTNIKRNELIAQDNFLAEWIPRIIYFLIVSIVAYSIVTGPTLSSI
ncbi:hypothetical protein A9Q79_07015 [Methylophaga sp. 42_25_T18]|nr:hypothetical protein A9Q79_07015 [Methylophaga sp. 42_25_T18]OUR89059.1 hypothetical protein A9Q92_01615 [Methylophaga sp. 42_8_T64]